MKRMKKIAFILIGLSCITGSSYLIWQDIFVDPYIPRGYTDSMENREETPWMDWTDFCWYQYTSANDISLTEDYQQVTEKDVSSIKGYFSHTRMSLECANRLAEFEFVPACINEGDAWLLFTSEGEPRGTGTYEKYDNYKMYFFDTESERLYYINNNS